MGLIFNQQVGYSYKKSATMKLRFSLRERVDKNSPKLSVKNNYSAACCCSAAGPGL